MSDSDPDATVAGRHVDPIVAIVIDASESAERTEATAGVAIRAARGAVGPDRVLVVGHAATEAWALRDGVRWLASDGTPLGGLEVAVLAADGAPLLYCSGNDAVLATGLDALAASLVDDAVTVSGTEWDVDGEPVRTPEPFDWAPHPGTLIATRVVAADTERRGLVAALRIAARGGWRNVRTDAVAAARIGDTSPGARVRADASTAAAIVRSVGSSFRHGHTGRARSLLADVADAARALRGLAVLAAIIAAGAAIVASGTRGPSSQLAIPAIGLVIVAVGALALLERQRPGGDVCELVRSIDVSTSAVTAVVQRARPQRARQMRTGGRALLARPITTLATVVLEGAITYAAVRLATADRAHPAGTWAPIVSLGAGVVLLAPMLVSLGVVVRVRPRRASSRAELTFSAAVDGRPSRVVDVSIGGLAVAAPSPTDVGDHVTVLLGPEHGSLPMTVVRCSPSGRRYTIGLQLDPDAPAAARAALERTWLDATQRAVTAPTVRPAPDASPSEVRPPAGGRTTWTLGGSVAVRVTTAVTLMALGAAVLPPYPATFAAGAVVVNSTGNEADSNPGDGSCTTGLVNSAGQPACTLRAAIQEANASATVDTIEFAIPTTDPGYAAGRGVFTIAPSSNLPALATTITIDGASQAVNVGDTNPGSLGSVGTVGTGPDGVLDTGDEPALDGVAAPEIELDYSGQLGLVAAADDVRIAGLAVFGANPDVMIAGGADVVVEDMVVGTRADSFTDPGAGARSTGSGGVAVFAGSNAQVRDSLIGYQTNRGIEVNGTMSSLTISGNEITGTSQGTSVEGGGIEIVNFWSAGEAITGALVTGNLIHDRVDDYGIEVATDVGDAGIVIDDNTILGRNPLLVYGNPNVDGGTISHNVVRDSIGHGVYVDEVTDWTITENSITNSTWAGIGLSGTANDGITPPDITTATAGTGTVDVEYSITAPAGAYQVEFFDNAVAGTGGNGEGETYLGSDPITHPGGTAAYSHTVTGAEGDIVSATLTEDLGGGDLGSTSEFSNAVTVPPGAPDPVVLEHIQKATTTIADGSTTTTVTIDPVDLTRSVLMLSVRGDNASPENIVVAGYMTGPSTFVLRRSATVGVVTVDWSVLTFESGVTVQHGHTKMTSVTQQDVSIDPVDLTRTFPLVSWFAGGAGFDAGDFVGAQLTSETNLRLSAVNATSRDVYYQIVSYNDAEVQRGTVALGSAASSATATVGPVDTTTSWLTYTITSANGTAANIGQKLVRGRVTNATTLTFDRSSTGQAMDVQWHLVEFTDGTLVQSGTSAFGTGATQNNVAITAVDPARSVATGGYLGYGGRSSYTADDNPGVGWFTTRLTSRTNLRARRGVTGSATADLGWFVITWTGTGPDTVTVNSTDDDADLFAGDGYCDTGGVNTTGHVECTVRAAIQEANASSVVDTIHFAIPGAGPTWTISPSSALPTITAPATIDATTQTGWTAEPVVNLSGAVATAASGLELDTGSDGSVVSGLAIHSFDADGITIGTSNNRIQRNRIGTDTAGGIELGNQTAGIYIWNGAGNVIGGAGGLGNLIVDNADGVVLDTGADSGNAVLENDISGNIGLGIDLGNNGVTVNDPGDADTGPNDRLNFPVVSSAVGSSGTVTVDFSLDVPAGTYRVEAFTNPSGADPTGYGEGETFEAATTVTHPGGGAQNFQLTYPGASGDVLTLTATRDLGGGDFGSTSEFSAVVAVASGTVVVNSTGNAADASPGNGVCDTGGTNAAGADECTLRAAIEEADAHPLVDAIEFDIPTSDGGHAAGVWTIAPTAQLPTITGAVTIDATTHPGYGTTPVVSISGAGVPVGAGLDVSGDDVTVRGVNVRAFPGDGVSVTGARFTLEASHIGTNAAGTAASPNALSGLLIAGPDATVQGNLVSGNSSNGIRVQSGGDRARIVDNRIGTTVTGNAALPNGQEGVEIDEADDVVVGEPGLGNVLSGNAYSGINGWAGDATGAVIQGNLIGVGADGSTALGNSAVVVEGGITIRGPVHDWTIGGTGPGEGNVIANNIGDGISLIDVNGVADDIAILGNSIHADTGLGIDIGDDGVTANDAGDADTGINDRLNSPVLSSAIVTSGTTEVAYSLDLPAGDYRVEFFTNPSGADPTGYGEGETFVHAETIAHAGLGSAGFTTSFAGSAGDEITATVTEDLGLGAFGSTSEFSEAVFAASSTVVVNSTGNASDASPGDGMCETATVGQCTLRAAIQEANASATVDTIEFDIPDTDPGHAAGVWTIAPTSQLPSITAAVTIDATTQPGTVVNTATAPAPMNGALAITLSGSAMVSGSNGLILGAGSSSSEIRGLSFTGLGSDAVRIDGSSDNLIAGNHVGADAAGTAAAGNSSGLTAQGGASDNRIGGSTAADRNLFVGNSYTHIALIGSGVTGTIIQGNELGWFAGGAEAPEVADFGIVLWNGTSANLIGGSAPGEANRIRGAWKGVLVDANLADSSASILGNHISDSLDVGIDLLNDGVTPNDPGDADTGPNDLLNVPVISSAVVAGATVEVSYSLDVPAGNYRVEFFTNPSGADPTGYGEGEVFVHAETVSTAGSGPAAFTASFAGSAGDVITATLTEDHGAGAFGATSEFSAAVVAASPTVVVNSTGDAADAAAGDGTCDTGGTNSAGDPECTLRAAITEANAHTTVDTIEFDIPVSDAGHVAGVWSIQPSTALPAVTAAVSLDGTSQPGWTATPVIAIDGSGLGGATDGLTLGSGSGGSEVRGLAVGGFPGHGVLIDFGSSGNLIAGNHIGTDAAGAVDAGNGSAGVLVWTDGNTIGGTTAADRNVISGNDGYGIYVGATTGNVFQGNHIGVDVTGNNALGNTWNGIYLGGGSDGNIVDGNVIGDNGDIGIRLEAGSNHVITANSIGVGADGTSDVGNLVGISARFGSTDILIGGADPSDANVIANNGHGIVVMDAGTARVAIVGNEIRDNDDLGIDLEDDGVTPNDAGDADTGPNDHLNFPVFTSAADRGGEVDVTFDLDVPAGSYRIELFANPSGADPTGYGEGAVLVDGFTVTHPGGGRRTYTTRIPGAPGDVLTATATEDLGGGAFGSTSELSQATTVEVTGSTVGDLSQRRSDLVSAGGATGPGGTGVAGTGVTFGGGYERLVGPATDLTSGAVTLSAWVQLDASSTSPRLVSKRAQSGAIYELLVDDATGAAEARFGVGGSEVAVQGGALVVGTWHQVAATWDGSTVRLYVDGAEVAQAPASGALATDLSTPLVVGNVVGANRGLIGSLDTVQVAHTARSSAWIETAYLNQSNPTAFVSVGEVETATAGTWSASSTVVRNGGWSLAAPAASTGAEAWATATGLDEPGLAFESWWYVTSPATSRIAAGTNAGATPIEQRELGATDGTVDLATRSVGGRTVDASSAAAVPDGTWTRVEIRTDELGRSSAWIDGVQVIGPTPHGGGTSAGTVGLRAGAVGAGGWYVDDVRIRRYVSDEPTTTLGPLHRN